MSSICRSTIAPRKVGKTGSGDWNGIRISGGDAERSGALADGLDGETAFAEALHARGVGVPPAVEHTNERPGVQERDLAAMLALQGGPHRVVSRLVP